MTDAIRFILNQDDRVLRGIKPSTTVLDYLRLNERLTGSKEGCAEGDCGACTVMLAEVDPNGPGLRYRAVNACILTVGQLDGRQLVTVEHIKSPDGQPHGVQTAMVDCHASQCGFCTPGFVMSLTTLTQCRDPETASTDPVVVDEEIAQAIAGNLCRCTGYRPILDAARKAVAAGPAPWLHAAEFVIRDRLDSLTRINGLAYEADGEFFYAPRRLEEFNAIMAKHPDATILGGGTDVGLWLTKMHKRIKVLVHTNQIAELHGIHETDDAIDIGGAVTWHDALPVLGALDPSLATMLHRFGSAQVRASGTLGGNIANGSPIGDGMPPLIALGTEIELAGPQGRRRLPLEDLYIAYRKTARAPDELVSRIIVPKPQANQSFRVYKLSKRFDQDISAVCAAFLVSRDQAGVITSARTGFGGVAGIPARAKQAEAALVGQTLSQSGIAGALKALDAEFQPLSDMRASAEYRRLAVANLLRRFALEIEGDDGIIQVYRHA